MVAGVALPQNPNSAPFRFSLGYHNITIPGDRSHHAPVPKHVIIDRDKDDNEYYTRLFAKEQSYRSMLRILGIDGNGFSDRRFRVHAPNTKNSSFPKKPMKQKKKFILITLSVITILLLLGFGTTRCYLSSKYKKIAERMRSDYKAAPNQQQLPLSFYLTFGYFPRSMDEALDFYHREIQPDESKETLRAQQVLQDPFSRDSCEIQYVPLYDYETKKPVSFILLSAGVDGKMDNKITPSDTLYLNNWWAKLDVYNYEEAVLLQDYWIKWEDLCRAYGEDIETLLKYNPPYPELALHFTMRNYLWGKKDWIIQLGLLE